MKIIATILAKNEDWILDTCLTSLAPLCDEILLYDDNSNDHTRDIALRHHCVILPYDETLNGFANKRNYILRAARMRDATHLVCIDADEALWIHDPPAFKKCLSEMVPGQKICLPWITLWKTTDQRRVDGIWDTLTKDVIFCDDRTSDYGDAFISEPRTPLSSGPVTTFETDTAVLLHYQFVYWDRVIWKQAWYRCIEFLKGTRSAYRINGTYSITKETPSVNAQSIPHAWKKTSQNPHPSFTSTPSWHARELLLLFDKYTPQYFEYLDIWDIPELRTTFVALYGRDPHPHIPSRGVMWLNKIKNLCMRRLFMQ